MRHSDELLLSRIFEGDGPSSAHDQESRVR